MTRWWRDHSRTLVSLAIGSSLMAVSWHLWPEGGNAWDTGSGIGTVMLAFGVEGIVNNWFREVAKPED